MLKDLIRLARPRHWIKGSFIVAPIPFAVAAGASFNELAFVAGLLGFSLLSSSVYVFNDLHDVEADRRDPRRQDRPLVAGTVSKTAAWVECVTLFCVAALLFWISGVTSLFLIGGIYAAFNIVYSLRAKHLPLIDVFILTSGFVLRVLAGCAIVSVTASNWLLLCSSTLAFFLSFAKRRADLYAGFTGEDRGALSGYNLAFLDHAMTISAAITVVAYAAYAQESKLFWPGRELAGLPFIAFAVLDYLRLAFLYGIGASPTEIAYRSVPIRICVSGWILASIWSLGLFERWLG